VYIYIFPSLSHWRVNESDWQRQRWWCERERRETFANNIGIDRFIVAREREGEHTASARLRERKEEEEEDYDEEEEKDEEMKRNEENVVRERINSGDCVKSLLVHQSFLFSRSRSPFSPLSFLHHTHTH
jgi:hypothetical protein